ncbi:DUF1963 domain-containing protein [Bacillus changyiensis]|uniref:DUF1963 domain-containing protein n=1 Tax=Bacillus changyiensis TaxID=3004103 RepID=UPI0022E25759|nr:DUF1963 domain-containing protein [Bacillus changyiensis]MDA1475175.1 DUF1963 domain-containing protein [Bacillus changyiensis]
MEIEAFKTLKDRGKTPVIAQIGGFRPEVGRHSWFGGHFYINTKKGWPSDQDGYMIPLLQAYLPEIPGGIESVGESGMIQVFLNRNTLPLNLAKNGDGWKLIEYRSIDGLQLVDTPKEASLLREFQMKWSLSKTTDYPCWEEAWTYADLTEVNEDDEMSDRFFDDFSRYSFTKIGGYASYIQSPVLSEDFQFVMQIASEEKPRFMVGDNGNLYFFRSLVDGEWYMNWDCF